MNSSETVREDPCPSVATKSCMRGRVDARGIVYKKAHRPNLGAMYEGRFRVASNGMKRGIIHFSV